MQGQSRSRPKNNGLDWKRTSGRRSKGYWAADTASTTNTTDKRRSNHFRSAMSARRESVIKISFSQIDRTKNKTKNKTKTTESSDNCWVSPCDPATIRLPWLISKCHPGIAPRDQTSSNAIRYRQRQKKKPDEDMTRAPPSSPTAAAPAAAMAPAAPPLPSHDASNDGGDDPCRHLDPHRPCANAESHRR